MAPARRINAHWQVLSKGQVGEPFIVTNAGYYDDTLIKWNGEWLIQSRNIPQ